MIDFGKSCASYVINAFNEFKTTYNLGCLCNYKSIENKFKEWLEDRQE